MKLSGRGIWIIFCCVLMSAWGCHKQTGNVAGTVRFEEQTLPNGRVVFYCDGGEQPVLMSPIVDGTYTIQDAPTGDARITVETFETKTTTVPGQFNSPDTGDLDFTENISGPFVRLPDRFRAPDQSNLRLTIEPGDNRYDIDLAK